MATPGLRLEPLQADSKVAAIIIIIIKIFYS